MIVERIRKVISKKKEYSNFKEEEVIKNYLNQLDHKKIAVDIAAQDGIGMSNTYSLFKSGYTGLAVECDSSHFASLANSYKELSQVSLSKIYVYPENVVQLLKAYEIPRDFGFLSFDIDGYDHFVMYELLKEFRPSLICAEVNEKIPYPIKFSVNYDRNFVWDRNHFFGQSISQLYLLCEQYDYDLVQLYYNNAFLIPREKNNKFPKLHPKEAYLEGYKSQPDRQKKFPYNKDVDVLLEMTPMEALNFINTFFKKYEGKYTASI